MNESAAAWLCVLPLISLVIMIFAVMQLILAQRAHERRAAEAGQSAPRPDGHHDNRSKSLTKKDGLHLTRVTVWTEDTSLNSECAVCLEPFGKGKLVRVLRCKHAFHVKCIECWFSFKGGCDGDNLCNEWRKRCPLCMAACVSESSMRSLPDETAATSSGLPLESPSDIESATGSLSSLQSAREEVMEPGRQWMGRVTLSVDSVHRSVQIGSPVPIPPGASCVPGAVVFRGLAI